MQDLNNGLPASTLSDSKLKGMCRAASVYSRLGGSLSAKKSEGTIESHAMSASHHFTLATYTTRSLSVTIHGEW